MFFSKKLIGLSLLSVSLIFSITSQLSVAAPFGGTKTPLETKNAAAIAKETTKQLVVMAANGASKEAIAKKAFEGVAAITVVATKWSLVAGTAKTAALWATKTAIAAATGATVGTVVGGVAIVGCVGYGGYRLVKWYKSPSEPIIQVGTDLARVAVSAAGVTAIAIKMTEKAPAVLTKSMDLVRKVNNNAPAKIRQPINATIREVKNGLGLVYKITFKNHPCLTWITITVVPVIYVVNKKYGKQLRRIWLCLLDKNRTDLGYKKLQ